MVYNTRAREVFIKKKKRGGKAYLCACLFNSCLRVCAGFASGLGPLRFGFSPSAQDVEYSK